MPMPYYRNTNYAPFYALLGMALICILTIAGPRFIRPAMNKNLSVIELRDYEKAFRTLQHPSGTTPLALRTTSGVLMDAEQGCDFFVGEIRQFNGTQDAIPSMYAEQLVSGNPLEVAFLEAGQMPSRVSSFLPEPIKNLAGWDLPPASTGQPMYLVYLLVVGFEGDLRLNCR